MILLVVALTRNINREYWRNTLSMVPQSSDRSPHTSLPYIRICFIKTSNKLNMISIGKCVSQSMNPTGTRCDKYLAHKQAHMGQMGKIPRWSKRFHKTYTKRKKSVQSFQSLESTGSRFHKSLVYEQVIIGLPQSLVQTPTHSPKAT